MVPARKSQKEQLISFLRGGVLVGIATGRGKSVRRTRQRIRDPDLSSRLLIGYHNGAEIGFLNDDSQPPLTGQLDESLAAIAFDLKDDPRLPGLVRMKTHHRQITLELLTHSAAQKVWEVVQGTLSRHGSPDVAALHSSHSVDILASGVSKSHVVREIATVIGCSESSSQVLCIGDRGRSPGNDFALLQEPCSLSVDEVSSDPATCWNLASAKTRCTAALLEYFQGMRFTDEASGSAFDAQGVAVKDALAENLLAHVLGWNAEDMARERPLLQAMASYKYDDYQQFSPGMHSSKASPDGWPHSRRPTNDSRHMNLSKHVWCFAPPCEVNHLVEMAYPDHVRPFLIRSVAREIGVNPRQMARITNNEAFRIRQRQCLFLGLSDGARIAEFRRANREVLNNEQIWQTHELSLCACGTQRVKRDPPRGNLSA